MISTDAEDNLADLQALVDAAEGGGEVLLSGPGVYHIAIGPITKRGLRLKSGVTLRGVGNPTLHIADGSAQFSQNALVWAQEATDITIQGITFDAGTVLEGSEGDRTNCLELLDVTGVNISDCTFKNAIAIEPSFSAGYGIVAWYGGGHDVTITDCRFEDIGQSDLALFWGTNWRVSNCQSFRTRYCPINVETVVGGEIDDVVIDGWTIDRCNLAAMTVIQNGSSTVSNVTIKNVVATDAHDTDIYVSIGTCRIRGTTGTTLENITIRGCKSHAVYVTVDSGYPVENLTIRNLLATHIQTNPDRGTPSHGVWLAGTTAVGIDGVTLENVVTQLPTGESFVAEHVTDLSLDPATTIAQAIGGLTLVGTTATLFAD